MRNPEILDAGWLDWLWTRLTATYGRRLLDLYAGVEPEAVKAQWAETLGCFNRNPQALEWVVQNLPELVPNPVQLRNLAMRAPAAPALPEPEPVAQPARVRAELKRLAEVRRTFNETGRDGRGWARNLVERAERGEPVSRHALREAKVALGLLRSFGPRVVG